MKSVLRRSNKSGMLSKLLLLTVMMLATSINVLAEDGPRTTENKAASNTKILVIRALDNVKSNYYDHYLLAENTGIAKDSVNQVYNEVVEQNLQSSGTGLNFIGMDEHKLSTKLWTPIVEQIQLKGDGENMRADLSSVNKTDLKRAMQNAGASYLLVIDAQYLRYSEQPMPMMYHFVNYTLYDSDEKQLTSGQNYFSAYQPQSKKALAKSSMKTVRKIADEVSKVIKHF